MYITDIDTLMVLFTIFKTRIYHKCLYTLNTYKLKTILAPGNKRTFIDRNTGKFRREVLEPFIYEDTDDRFDLETGKYIEKDFLGVDVETGLKIDIDSGEFYKEYLLSGYEKTDTRVNQKTGDIENKGILGWKKTNERVNPETGKRQRSDWLGYWHDIDE